MHAEQPIETAKAAQAFADYIALGHGRSLRALHARYCQQSEDKPPTKRFETLAEWSTKYCWQDRIAEAASAKAIQMLIEAAELDAESFLETSRQLHRRLSSPEADEMDLVSLRLIREQVRRPEVQNPLLTVNVTSMERLAQRLAADLGISADDLLKDAEAIAREAWGKDE